MMLPDERKLPSYPRRSWKRSNVLHTRIRRIPPPHLWIFPLCNRIVISVCAIIAPYGSSYEYRRGEFWNWFWYRLLLVRREGNRNSFGYWFSLFYLYCYLVLFLLNFSQIQSTSISSLLQLLKWCFPIVKNLCEKRRKLTDRSSGS